MCLGTCAIHAAFLTSQTQERDQRASSCRAPLLGKGLCCLSACKAFWLWVATECQKKIFFLFFSLSILLFLLDLKARPGGTFCLDPEHLRCAQGTRTARVLFQVRCSALPQPPQDLCAMALVVSTPTPCQLPPRSRPAAFAWIKIAHSFTVLLFLNARLH